MTQTGLANKFKLLRYWEFFFLQMHRCVELQMKANQKKNNVGDRRYHNYYLGPQEVKSVEGINKIKLLSNNSDICLFAEKEPHIVTDFLLLFLLPQAYLAPFHHVLEEEFG